MTLVFKEAGSDEAQEVAGNEEVQRWWLIATAALFQLNEEFTPDRDVLSAILDGEIQLYESRETKGAMPTFKATVRGQADFIDVPRKIDSNPHAH